MKNFWRDSKKPTVCLAPMAGITDQPFRLICKQFGADVVFSEMVSSDAIWHKKEVNSLKLKVNSLCNNLKFLDNDLIKTLNLIRFSKDEMPYVVQIFGSDPQKLAYTTEYISTGEWAEDYKKIINYKLQIINENQNPKLIINNQELIIMSIPDGIDINMGCPAKDIIKQGAGSDLMKNYKLASQIIKSVKKSTKLPVSVKTRLGWSDPKEILEFSKIIENAGADALTIHGRTYKQGFTGPADWDMVYKVKNQLKIPVILNGGVNSLEDFNKIDLDKIDGVMIGHGALGRPWVFKEINNCTPPARWPACPAKPRRSEKDSSEVKEVAGKFNFQLLKETILKHAELVQKLKGERGIIEMRKHLAWYFRGVPNSKEIREKLVKVSTLEEIREVLN